jgi:dTDP-glucose 4,6-dehydratase
MTILVTGGAGFIGSNLLHHLVSTVEDKIICVDNLTYAADWHNIPDPVILYTTDIADEHNCEYIFKKYKPKTVFHLAAESHVDNSIKDCAQFIHTNINGTVNLLKLSLKYEVDRFMHISTDEVYGTIEEDSFTEKSNYNPRNPYSASKASSDHFVNAFHNTYGLPTIITNCSNNYGPRQYKEKLIPQTILNLLEGKKVPIYGDGKQIRDWLYVQDHCEALVEVWSRGRVGQKYNIGGECEIKNIDLVRMILDYLNMNEDMIEYVQDRPGHDRRYSTSITKIRHEIKWAPRFNIEEGLEKTIKWYECNRNNS